MFLFRSTALGQPSAAIGLEANFGGAIGQRFPTPSSSRSTGRPSSSPTDYYRH